MLRTELSKRPDASRVVKSASRAALTRLAIWSSAQSSERVSQWSEWGARYRTVVTRCGLTASWKALAPLGQSVPSLIGLRGSPSMSMSCPFFV